MAHADSVSKIVTRYFACLTRKGFEYRGKQYQPRPLVVSPLLLRGYTCPSGCGGCCNLRFSLDYLPSEPQPEGVVERQVEFDGRRVSIFSDFQTENAERHCQHLDTANGRCGIYRVRPFSCDFELIRTLASVEGKRPNTLTQKLFGRGWNMLRIDGERGALCEMTPPTEETKQEVIRKLRRLMDWAEHFGIPTWAPEIISLIERNRLTRPATLANKRGGFFGS